MIDDGAVGAAGKELGLVQNCNFLHGYVTPPWACHGWEGDLGRLTAALPVSVRSAWRRRLHRDFTHLVAEVTCSAVGSGSTVEFWWASTPATVTTLACPAGGAWQVARVAIPYPVGLPTRDTLVCQPVRTVGSTLVLRSVSLWPEPLSSLLPGASIEGVIPLDSDEANGDKPLSTHLRQTQLNNLDIIRETRTDTVVLWSEDYAVRASYEAYRVTSASWTPVARIPFSTLRGQTTLEWALLGYGSGATRNVRLSTYTMTQRGVSPVVVALPAGPLGTTWTDDGGSVLQTAELTDDLLTVELQSDGAGKAYLYGLGVWMAEG